MILLFAWVTVQALAQSFLPSAGSRVLISSPQMFPWCPHWCRRPTAAAWRSTLTDILWTWTGPSTNTTTFARTPAPCWTLCNDKSISLPKLIHTQFIQAMEMISNIFIKALTSGEMFYWNVKNKKTKDTQTQKMDQVSWCSLEP